MTVSSSFTLPIFLAPILPGRAGTQIGRSPHKEHRHDQRFVGTASNGHNLHKSLPKTKSQRNSLRPSKDVSSLQQSYGKFWLSILEPYLPENLRNQKSYITSDAPPVAGAALPAASLHHFLEQARNERSSNRDLLAYVGIEEDRWDAVIWLVNLMLEVNGREAKRDSSLPMLQSALRREMSLPLDVLTTSPEATEELIHRTNLPQQSLKLLTGPAPPTAAHKCIGQIWQSLGSMIIKAADRAPGSIEATKTMSYVYQILAQLHHRDIIPHSIYNHAPAEDPSVLQRPPTLHLLSRRIMAALSDASWNVSKHKNNPGNVATTSESEPITAELRSQIQEVETHIWLDLVLWSCIEGGWIIEAASIVDEMGNLLSSERGYGVIDWNTLREQSAPELPWLSKIKLAINKSRMGEVAGGDVFGHYADRPEFLKPPSRTVSSEVISALVDALTNTACVVPQIYGRPPGIIEKYISACRKLLDQKNLGLESSSWNCTILRLVDYLSSDPDLSPTFLEHITSWSPSYLQESETLNSAYRKDSPVATYVADPSAATLGFFHRQIETLCHQGDVHGAVRVFRKLQYSVDRNRRTSLRHFELRLVNSLDKKTGDTLLVENRDQQEIPGLNSQIPAKTLAVFLDLVTDVEMFDIGKWLLYSDDVDGCTIPPSMYLEPVIQPALIRFASATSDDGLLANILKNLHSPLSEATLRALLHYHISHGKWDAVREILSRLRDNEGMGWDATDVMALVKTLLRKEESCSQGSQSKYSQKGTSEDLLVAMLRGEYNTTQDPSQPRDFLQSRMLNQLSRIIASVPSNLHELFSPFCSRSVSKLQASCMVSTRAFNMLLKSVVHEFNILAGKQLCDTWCLPFKSVTQTHPLLNEDSERVVIPNVQTIYVMLIPVSKARQNNIAAGCHSLNTDEGTSSQDIYRTSEYGSPSAIPGSSSAGGMSGDTEQDIVNWGIEMLMKLGMKKSDIINDLPGLVHSSLDRSTIIPAAEKGGLSEG